MVDGPADSAVDEPAAEPSPAEGAAPRRRWRRALKWTALVSAVLLVLGTATVYGAYRHYGGEVGTVAELPELETSRSAEGVRQSRDQVYLVVGSDSADGLTREQLRAVNTSRRGRDGTRTDTLLLVQVPADGRRARVVSLPRDSWVTVPGHGMAKINGAYDLGEESSPGTGPATLIATVERLSGLHVDHYVEVSLYGFVRITDALGGVEVCLSAPAVDEDARIDLPAGRQRLNGQQALGFVRQRQGLPGGDLGRIRRQQYFLSALTREVLQAGTLLNPLALDRLLRAVTSSVRVDRGTDQGDLLRLALQLRQMTAGAVRFQTVPVLDADARIGGQSVVLLDTAALPAFFADEEVARPPAAPPLTVPPSSIALVVENGTATPGFAKSVATALSGVGFGVRAVLPSRRTDVRQTLVRYGGGRADSARTTAAALPGSVLVRDDAVGLRGLVVTVGSAYTGVRRVTVKPAQDSGPGSAAAPRTAAQDDCIA